MSSRVRYQEFLSEKTYRDCRFIPEVDESTVIDVVLGAGEQIVQVQTFRELVEMGLGYRDYKVGVRVWIAGPR